MGVDAPIEACRLASSRDHLSTTGCGPGRAALGLQDEWALGPKPPELAQGTQFWPAQGLGAGPAVLDAADVGDTVSEVELAPSEGDQFADPQAVGVGQEDRRGVALGAAASASSAGCRYQLLDLAGGEMLSGSQFGVWPAAGW
jgi:hypothetical protein